MKAKFGYTGIRVCDLDKAVEFFTKGLGMKVQARIKAPWNKGEFVNLVTSDGKHWLEINWYADDSPAAGPYSEGEQLDHLGFEVDDVEGALKLLNDGLPNPDWSEESWNMDLRLCQSRGQYLARCLLNPKGAEEENESCH